jgi:hypothetical protein
MAAFQIVTRLFLASFAVTQILSCAHKAKTIDPVPGYQRLTCLLLGYDSLIYYTGTSNDLRGAKRGNIADTSFVNDMFRTADRQPFPITLKIGDGGDVIPNFQEVVALAKYKGIPYELDLIDSNEHSAFGVTTPPQIQEMIQNPGKPPAPLVLPPIREESGKPDPIFNFPESSRVVILLSGAPEVYVYMGGDLKGGRNYSLPELTSLLTKRCTDKNLSVLIKAGNGSSYHQIVDMLDEMKTTKVLHYALLEMTKEEKLFVSRLTL